MSELHAFIHAAREYSRSSSTAACEQLLRSPYSGLPLETALAAFRTRNQTEPLPGALLAGKMSLPAADREHLAEFVKRLHALSDSKPDDDALHSLFSLPRSEERNGEGSATAPIFAEPASREEAGPVSVHVEHFSASSLNTYVECARKWFYRYICGAIEDKASAASLYGTAFHAALEELHREFPRPGEASSQTLRSKLQGYINASFDRYGPLFETPVERELQRRRALRTASRYVDWLAQEAARAPFTVLGCEVSAALDLEGYAFIGFIDRLDQDDRSGTVTVIDYKTGAIAKTAAEYRDKIRSFHEFQLPFYYWARTAAGDRVSRLALVPLRDADLDVAPISLEVVPYEAPHDPRSRNTTGMISVQDLERARSRMVELCRELIEHSPAHFRVTTDGAACRYCAYSTACVDRPFPPEDRFAR